MPKWMENTIDVIVVVGVIVGAAWLLSWASRSFSYWRRR